MSTLHDLRQGILNAVGTVSATTFDHVPARLAPPAIIVLPGSPYMEPGDVYGSYLVRHSISVVMPNGTNEKITEDVDDLLESVVKALAEARVSIDTVSTFYVYESNAASYLAVDITVSDNVRL